jgi:thiol-disulfide isomerase/thioredoxin
MRVVRFLTVIILGAVLCACGNKPSVNATLKDVDGKVFEFADLKGKWVVLNYWASWCHPCTKEIPELNAFYDKYKGKSVAVFGVNYDQVSPEEVKSLMKKMAMHYPNLAGDPATVLGLGDIPGIPVTFIFNPQGQLVDKLMGEQTVKSLEATVKV